MLNLKKGLALVLAAATAFTFAPVANLGAPVKAEAATEAVFTTENTKTVALRNKADGTSQTKQFTLVAANKLGLGDEVPTVHVETSNKDIIKLDATSDSDGDGKADIAWGGSFTLSGNTKQGTATITLSDNQADHGPSVYKQTITVSYNITGEVLDLGAAKITGQRVKSTSAGDYFAYKVDNGVNSGNTTAKAEPVSVNATPYNLDTTNYNYHLDVISTNKNVIKVADASARTTISTTDSPITLNFTIVGKGSANVTARLYKQSKAVGSTPAGVDTLIAEKSFTVQIDEGIDELKVSYDGNRDGKATDYTLHTSSDDVSTSSAPASDPNGEADSIDNTGVVAGTPTQYYIKTKTLQTTETIYLDTKDHTSAQIVATDSDKRPVIFSSNSNEIVVDQSGKVSLTAKALADDTATTATNGATITVRVPQQGTKSGFVINVHVVVSKVAATNLTVNKENGDVLATALAGNDNLIGVNTTNFRDKLTTFYLSRKDKTSASVKISSNAGTGYLTAGAYTGLELIPRTTSYDVNNVASDYVGATLNGDTITLTALKDSDKDEEAIVKVTAYSNGQNIDDTAVYFRVVVSTKKANIKVTAPSIITLTSVNKTAKIGATVNSTTSLQYKFVNGIGDNKSDGTDSYGDVSLDQAGNVTYTGKNSGSAVIRVTGWSTADSLAPDAAYVTVNYAPTKNAQTITVDPASVNLKAGETAQINAKSVVTGAALTYKSSDETVATVDATGKVTAVAAGNATITVSAPATADFEAGTATVAVKVTSTAPAKVTGLKVKNAKGAKVSVTWDSQDKNVQYRVYKKVGNGKWIAKNVTKGKASLSVKKGAKVQVKVKSFVKDADGTTVWGPKAAKKTLKTDKK